MSEYLRHICIKSLAILYLGALLAGCSQIEVEMAPAINEKASNRDQANIIFIRSSPFNNKETSSVFRTEGDQIEFIGILNNDKRISFKVDPGQHVFMVASNSVEYMHADVRAGLTYYVMVAPGIGASTRQFALWPVRKGFGGEYYTDSRDFPYWLANTQAVKNSKKSFQWFSENRSRIEEMHRSLWPAWGKGMNKYELQKRTLNADDGL